MSQPFNLLIDEFASSQNYEVQIGLGILENTSEGGLTFTTLQQYIPDIVLNLTLRLLSESEAQAITTFLIDNRANTFPFDLTYYRIDYNGTNTLIQNAITGIQHVKIVGENISYKPMPSAVQLHEMSFQLRVSRNIVE